MGADPMFGTPLVFAEQFVLSSVGRPQLMLCEAVPGATHNWHRLKYELVGETADVRVWDYAGARWSMVYALLAFQAHQPVRSIEKADRASFDPHVEELRRVAYQVLGLAEIKGV